jgi:PAS domain S-box-containing protein
VQQILKVADCLLWRARVFQKRSGIDADWVLSIPRSNLYHRLFGQDPPEHPTELWNPQIAPGLEEMNARSSRAILAGETEYEQEVRLLLGGRSVWLHEHVSITALGPGEWTLTGILMDITATRDAEEARRQVEARLQQILTVADCLLWQAIVTDREGAEPSWDTFAPRSALYTELFGKDPVSSTDGRFVLNWWKLKVPELSEMENRYKDALRRGLPGYEHEFRAYVGPRTYWLREQVSIRYLEPGRFELVGVITDISGRREAEQALASEKERLAVTLRAMAEGVITTDAEGRVQYLNPAAASLIQCDAQDAAGRPIADVCALQDEHSGKPVAVSGELAVQGDRVAELPAETWLITQSGTRRKVEGCCAPIHASDSKVIGMVLVFRDVTERERLEQELMRSSRLESVGVLAGGIAHDFNNILTVVMGNLSLAQLDIEGGSEMARCIQEAERATLRARNLTQELLTFAHGGEPVRSAVDLAAVVRDVSEFALHGTQVKSVFDLPADLWPVDADKGQIGRVVQNLVINAFQAMPNGGWIRVSARNESVSGFGRPSLAPGDYVHISIEDTGTGIDLDVLPRVFDPYFTTKQSGSGLGLAAAYSIVKKHRGLIDVESDLGRGTTFHFWLPALRAGKPAAETASPEVLAPLKGRVLFMDDEASIRQMAAVLMRRIGLEVAVVSDGREAVEQFRIARAEGRPFAVVVMDLTVPGGMGGCEALNLLREIDPGVKAIVSSGYSSDPVLANYRDYGFCGVVSKPYEVAGFSRVLAEVLGQR